MRKAVILSIILVGFTAMASQIVLMREFLIVFWGNELVIGFVLASWLAWGAAGSWFSGRIAGRTKSPTTIFCICQSLISIFLPLSLLAVRSIKPFLGIAAGEIVPFSLSFISSFIVLAPICAISGFMFSLGCRMYSHESDVAAAGIGTVYILEAVGSMAGGLLASFILIRFLPSLHIMAILSVLNLFGALSLRERSEAKPPRRGRSNLRNICHSEERSDEESKREILRPPPQLWWGAQNDKEIASGRNFGPRNDVFSMVLIIFFIGYTLAWPLKLWDNLNQRSLEKQWKGYQLLDSRNSIYSNLSVVKKGAQVSFFSNGLHLYTMPDRLTSEEAVHFALLEHPEPQAVLLVGGGAGGLIEEIIKHPIKTVDYAELDPMILDLSRTYLSKKAFGPLEDARVFIHHSDGRRFIKNTKKKYDCVIIHLANPYTAQLNRFYTVEFFKEVKDILNESGIMSFSVSSSENYISRELALFLGSLYRSLKEVFSDIKIVPGDTAYFIASNSRGMLTYDYSVFEKRIKMRGIRVDFVRDYYLEAKLSGDRIEYIQNRLKQQSCSMINYDWRPVCYYYDMILQATHFSGSLFKRLLLGVNEKRIYVFSLCIGLFLFLSGLWGIKNKAGKNIVLTAVMATGFSEIVFQVVVLLSFQIIYGYVFYKLGLILTSFMVGLAMGAWWIVRIMHRLKNDLISFFWTQLCISVYPLLLPLAFWFFSNFKGEAVSWFGSNVLFSFLPVIAGFIGGVQFPLANKIYPAAGLSYGLDLFGSCLGAILTATFLIPILGIAKACFLAAGINFLILIVFGISMCYSNKT